MKKVLTLGADGVLGSEITRQLEAQSEVTQRCFDICPISYQRSNGENVQGDVCDQQKLQDAVKGMDYIVCSLNGDWLKQASTIVSVVQKGKKAHIIWVTGMGIHNEVPGLYGRMWRKYAQIYPNYIKAADVIAQSGLPYTLVRTADLTQNTNNKYRLYKEGEKVKSKYVSRAAVAKMIVDLITSERPFGINESIGITN